MNSIPWILIAVFVLIVFLAFIAVLMKKKYKTPTDYYAFFWMGIIWLIAGLPLKNYALSAMGLIFTVIGLANKNKWKTNRVIWNQLAPEQKKLRIALIVILSVLVVAGLVAYLLADRGIL